MKKTLLFALLILTITNINAQVVISQYTETNSGISPKGIEIWNSSTSDIDLSLTPITVFKGTNGAAPSLDLTINSGILKAGDVIVAGTDDTMNADDIVGECSGTIFVAESFTFNGDDALELRLSGVIVDVFGDPGDDPGSSWSGGGVSTANQNIKLKAGITTGDLDGWTDPSVRFEFVSSGSVLTDFGIAPTGCPLLPVKLISFEAQSKGNNNILKWSTASEINNDRFEIERSHDGRNFETIDKVDGQGTSYQVQSYSFLDKKVLNGKNYYRLKQVDFDGKYEYSDLVRADNTTSRIKIYPTSTTDYITIDMDEQQVASVVIFNEVGQTIKDMTISEMQTRIDISDLPSGMYFVQVNAQSDKEIKRIIKQ